MQFRRWWIASLFLVAVAGAGCGGGKATGPTGGTGIVEGYIYGRSAAADRADPPAGTVAINDALVTLAPIGRSDRTHADAREQGGYFRIADLPPGSYTATVTHPSYNDATFPVTVVAGATTPAGLESGKTTLEPTGSAPRRKWTVMVYMDPDNALEEFGVLNMNQMESIGSGSNVNIVVQFDRSAGYDQTNGDWSDTRRYLAIKDGDMENVTSPVLENLGEVDMAKPESLREFVTWSATHYPADHYAIVLWNHGAGWRSRAAATRGILYDDTSGSYMTMAQLNAGLTVPGVQYDLIAMDTSLMGMLEVAYEIKDRCPLVAFSEESPPGPGYPYHKILGPLASDPNMTGEELGRTIVSQHVSHYTREAVTQSLIKTSALPAFAAKVDAFGGALQGVLSTRRAEFDEARSTSQSYAYSFYHDLADFAAKAKALIPNAAVQTTAQAVIAGLPAANGGPVLAEGHNLAAVGGSNGLSIYLPGDSQFSTGYRNLRFCVDYPKWNQLLVTTTAVQ